MLLPTGTVTFLFSDIEGSTTRWEHHPEAMAVALARHDAILRQSVETHNGYIVKSTGDGILAAFHTAIDGLNAALAAQQILQTEDWPDPIVIDVRMVLHTGTAEFRDGDYFGQTLNRAARLMAAGHGKQLLLSVAAYELCRDALPPDVAVRNLGEYHLKDLSRPETIYQLLHPALADGFPALRAVDNSALPNNLPHQITSFVGRENEIAEVKELLKKTRLLTLTGSGGCGKTRLSLQVAAGMREEYSDGVWLAELAPLSDPALVPQTVAHLLGIKEQAGQAILETLVEALKGKHLLLLLDNCEHLISACAVLAAALLRSGPDIHIMATSRERLGIAGELIHRVLSLTAPDVKGSFTLQNLSQYESVRLFIERALLHKPDFRITNQNAPALAQLCYRLDGIPLAIELAAARIRSLSVEDINSRLDSRFRLLTGGDRSALPRQQTLRALVDWSYDLLDEREKIALARLSVFQDGWTLIAAENICGFAPIEEFEVLDLLTSLVDKSLVLAEDDESERTTRYRMLETLRQYGAEKQASKGEVEHLRDKHRDYFLALAEEAEPQLQGADQALWLNRLEIEHDNLRTALSWCAIRLEADKAMRLSCALAEFWMMHGYLSEGRERLEKALSNRSGVQAVILLKALNATGILAQEQGYFEVAIASLEESLALCRELGNKEGIGKALNNLGNAKFNLGDYATAQSLYEESLALYRELEDERGIGRSLSNLGSIASHRGNYMLAQSLFEESLTICRKRGEKHAVAIVLSNLGDVFYQQGDYEAARSQFEESLALCRALGERWGTAHLLESLAGVSLSESEEREAAVLWGAACALREGLGAPLPPGDQAELDRQSARGRSILGDEVFAAAWKEGQELTWEQAIEYALHRGEE